MLSKDAVCRATGVADLVGKQQVSANGEATTLPQPPVATYIEVPNSNEADTGADGSAPSVVREGSPGRTAREVHHARRHPALNLDPFGGRSGVKMDASQQSPTQVNTDRSYEVEADVYDSLPSTHPHDTDTGDRTLQPDDTGAVNFDSLHEFPRPSSQVSEDGGFENTRGDWRNSVRTSQHLSSITPFKPQNPTFETPALPKNPFAAGREAMVPLGGTQLFGQTQFSSAMKQISPGSSRPSPNAPLSNLSPNVAETSPLKNRANVSSPTDVRTSSPQRLDEVPTTVKRHNSLGRIEEETPSASRSTGEDMVPESPTNKVPRSSGSRQPLAHYETLKKSQERKYQGEPEYPIVASDSDSDSAVKGMERRRRLEQKRAQAAKEMESISFTPMPRRNSGDRPRVKRRKTDEPPVLVSASSEVINALVQSRSEEEAEVFVADSQQRALPPQPLEADVSTQGDGEDPEPEVDMVDAQAQDEPAVTQEAAEETAEERILATSPIGPAASRRRSDPELPRLDSTMNRILDSSNDSGEPSSLPPLNRKPITTYRAKSRQSRRRTVVSSPATEGPITPRPTTVSQSSPAPEPREPALEPEVQPDERADPTKDGQDNPGTSASDRTERPTPTARPTPTVSTSQRITRTRGKTTSPLTPLTNLASEGPPTSSSTGELSSAPPSSALTTPGTKDGRQPERAESIPETSPATHADETHASPHLPARSLRASRRNVRYGSESTDELYPSSSAGALERSVLNPKRSFRQFRQSIGQTQQRGNKLFSGMAFALSFQSNVKAPEREKLEQKIIHAGGVVLEDFEGLFEPSAVMDTAHPVFDDDEPLKLKAACSDIGFTALISDNHSRKFKYMQALALGLPCIAHQWLDACLESGQIVDWEHYLLCSGTSALLGNAIRSRTLSPYPATEARLADIIYSRRQLLLGQRILAVVDSKKRQSEAKRPYIFLAQALGPSISRVFTPKQAIEALAEHAKAEQPFDWLYFDQGKEAVKAVLSAGSDTKTKKRKRASGSTAQPSLEGIRELNDELIIQTLILGRVVQDYEMSALADS
jgi:hypothetical protein